MGTLAEQNSVLLEDQSANIQYKGDPCSLKLTQHGLAYQKDKSSSRRWSHLPMEEIIGACAEEGPSKRYCHLHVYIYHRPEPGCFSSADAAAAGARVAKHRTFAFVYADQHMSMNQCLSWANAIQRLSQGEAIEWEGEIVAAATTKKFLNIVNPVSGKGTAMSIFHCTVLPMMVQANISYELLTSDYPGHATDFTKTVQLEDYQCVVVIGGDGLVYEVINGLASRPDAEDALQHLPVAAIPGGSGNGLAKSVMHESGEEYSDIDAMFITIKGKPVPMDLSSYVTSDGIERVSFLSLGWGLISDVDLKTETYRWLGEARFTAGALYFIGKHRAYPAKISMLLANDVKADAVTMPALGEPLDDKWTVIEGSFLFFWAVQTTHASRNMYSGPGAHLSDGVFTIFLVRQTSRMNLAQVLIGIDDGGHAEHPETEKYRARAFRIEPLDNRGIYSLDGELVPYGPIQGSVWPAAARTMATDTLSSRMHT